MYTCKRPAVSYLLFHGYSNFFWIAVLTVLPVSFTDCPSKAQQKAFSCFNDYNRDLLNMQKSQKKLFTGVDTEILRAFCSSYLHAVSCIKTLKSVCPPEITENFSEKNFENVMHELTELCEDDRLYEIYARHKSCFEATGRQSERCFETIMNKTARLMTKVRFVSRNDMCGNLSQLQGCIYSHIHTNCGEEAAGLVRVLIKPMVWRSSKCDNYTVISTASSHKGHRSPTSAVPSTEIHVIHVIDREEYTDNGGHTHVTDIHTYLMLMTFLCFLHMCLSRDM